MSPPIFQRAASPFCGFASLLLRALPFLAGSTAGAQQRFPPPDFEGGYRLPLTSTPPARAEWLSFLDVGLLLGALGLALWLIYGRRSRRGVAALSLFSLAYFGFYREGCVCAIGSVQNVALALADPRYALPFSVFVFFLAPLLVALFAGRAFCAAVCPQGALQDWMLLKPVKVPAWLEEGLGLIPPLFLGAGVISAATGAGFWICRYDPIVPFFRFGGSTLMMSLGAAFLLVGIFVGRPYCRFLCPYGALLRLVAAVSKWRVRVTAAECTRCALCRESCPFGALREPPLRDGMPGSRVRARRRLALAIALLPVWIGAGAFAGARIGLAAGWFGGWAGLVIGGKLLALARGAAHPDFEPERGACLACGRCFESCPEERARRGGKPLEEEAAKP